MRSALGPLLTVLAIALCLPLASLAEPPPERGALSLAAVILRAEQYNPSLKAAEQGEQSARQGMRISQSLYYPTLDLAAVDSAGFPASAAAPTGFNGLMISPYRVGISGGIFSTWVLFDLTREYGVKASRYLLQVSQEETQVQRLQTDLTAVNLYMEAVLDLSQRETWKRIQDEVDRLYGVVRRFVKNGQYSEVTSWLLKNLAEETLRQQESFDLAFQAALRRIEILIGAPPSSIAIEGLPSLKPALDEISQHRLAESPLVTRPRAQTQVSGALAEQQSAQNWPRLLGMASAGGMDSSRLEPVENYSAWIGLTLPIFEGFRITAEEQRAEAEAERSADLARQAKLDLADADARFRQETLTRQSDARHYELERTYALKGLKLAEHRYTTFVGDLADVRDALRSWSDAESGLNRAQVDLYRSMLAQAITDGGYLAGAVGR